MYAPLQQAWTREIVLPACVVEQHFKALIVFLASFSLLGWTYALMALGLFYAYQQCCVQRESWILGFSPEYIYLRRKSLTREHKIPTSIPFDIKTCIELSGRPQSLSLGPCYISFRLQGQFIIIWQWQMNENDWRCLCTLARQVWASTREG